jgi:hypothetical protein
VGSVRWCGVGSTGGGVGLEGRWGWEVQVFGSGLEGL